MKINNIRLSKALLVGVFSASLLGLSSCNFLDFDESVGFESQEEVFEVFTRAEQSLTDVYSYLKHDFSTIGGAMRDCATDDAHYVWSNSNIHIYNDNRWTAINTIDAIWSDRYSGIRAANQFINTMESMDYSKYEWNVDYETWMEKSQYWISEARFLRSMYLFDLAVRYGDIPLANEIYTLDEVNTLNKTSFEDVVDYIAKECSEVAEVLPLSFSSVAGAQTGRATKGAALALKSRALLYAASPLHNDGNQELWKEAAKAAKEVMDLGAYDLITGESPVNNLESKQLIFERRMASASSFEKQNFPISFDQGNTGTCPTQNLVDAFQTKDGYDVTLTSNGWKSEDPNFDPKYPYNNRDPRFYETVIHDGAVFKNKTINSFKGGAEGFDVNGGSQTGYYLKKYILETVDIAPIAKPQIHTWVLFRYAEILLNYAEAMNQAYGADYTDGELTISATEAINKVRQAATLPALAGGMSKDDFHQALMREKRVEFAFEGHRFWDVRRWKVAPQTQVEIDGVHIEVEEGQKVYNLTRIEDREWEDKKYLYPIPMSELFKNTNLYPQNAGW